MAARLCVDASLALTLLLPQEDATKAQALWRSWLESNIEIVSAPLFFAEVTSVLRESVHFGRILPEEGEDAFDRFSKLEVQGINPVDLQARAWRLAREYKRPRAYDAQYMAVASSLSCELWTADRRLVNAAPVSWLRWVGDFAPDPA